MGRSSWLPTVLCLVLWAGAAGAIQPVKSLFTSLDLSQCDVLADGRETKGRVCAGLPGYPVFVAEGHGETFLSVGPDAHKRQAARQTLRAHNTVFDKSRRGTVEWRFVVRNQQPVPYATIVRYFTEGADGGTGEVLVVTRVTDRETCHVAYVDALANADAIVLARKLADTVARRASCAADPVVRGAAGRSPM